MDQNNKKVPLKILPVLIIDEVFDLVNIKKNCKLFKEFSKHVIICNVSDRKISDLKKEINEIFIELGWSPDDLDSLLYVDMIDKDEHAYEVLFKLYLGYIRNKAFPYRNLIFTHFAWFNSAFNEKGMKKLINSVKKHFVEDTVPKLIYSIDSCFFPYTAIAYTFGFQFLNREQIAHRSQENYNVVLDANKI